MGTQIIMRKLDLLDTIIFDLDGTLVDASPDIANATNYVLRQIGAEEVPQQIIARYIGGGAEMLWRRVLGSQADQLMATVLPMFMERYNKYYCVETSLYPGVMDVLFALRKARIKMGIATQKVEKITFGIIDQLQIREFFPVVIGPESVQNRKPHPESLLLILDRLGSRAEHALMVGDTPADIQAGKAAGVGTVAVGYGYGGKEELSDTKPDYMIDCLVDLLDIIE